jgi:serine protease inhibitor
MTITVNPNIAPTFTQVAAICNGATLAALPTTSTNSITGTWSPALNNTATTTYTFTPTTGQCATTTTMTITVNSNIAPTFTQVAAICNGATLAALPTTSTNSITGTWSPALNNTATTTYTFTPTAGQCATTATMTITVNTTPAPTGTASQTFCASPAPTVASLTATGTGVQWYAAANGGTALATTTALVNGTTYYATQTLNACESTTRLAVTVTLNDPQITASATTICSGTSVILSVGGVNGSSSSLFNSTKNFSSAWQINWSTTIGNNYVLKVSGTYGITSTSGIDADAAFGIPNQSPYNQSCIGYQDRWLLVDNCPARPTPDLYNSNHIYYYNIINSDGSVNISYSDSAYGDNSGSLTFELYNNITTYLWSTGETTATINPTPTTTTTYWCDVTVNGVTCRKTMTITVNPNITPAFTQIAAICNGATLAALPTTSNDGVTGTWSPALNNTATTTYIFTPTAGQCTTTATMTITVNTTPTPTGTASQTFCATPAPTVADLTATGTGVQWYAAATGGTALATTTALVNATTYYATQTLNACESTTRLAVTVTLNDPQITASATTICSGTPVTLSASTTATVAQNCNLPINLTNGLVGYWPFCGNANDVSGNANNGTVNGATLTTDRFGNANSAYSFDGISNNINLPLQQNGIITYTVSTWFKTSTGGPIVSGRGSSNQVGLTLLVNNIGTGGNVDNGKANFRADGPFISVGKRTNNTYLDNQWHHFVGVYNGAVGTIIPNQFSIYIDNVLVAQSDDVTASPMAPINNGTNILIGSHQIWQNVGRFNGMIDNLAIYNRAITPSEITQLYNSNQVTYLWSTGETTATINPIPTATTTYWCDVTVNGVTCRKTMTITVNPIINPTFTQVAAICNGATLAALPTTSTNSITGTWSPALNNTATTTYTFTPTAGQCATTATMTITVNPNIAPTFTQVAPICNGATLAALPTTSTNSITGTWSPALNNTATTTYTFTPTAGQCATTATMTITVNPNIAPTFTQVAAICNGATLAPLPTTSTNSITGTWSPALDNTATTTYTFTPTVGLCATTATMTITVNPNITPAFSQVPAICNGATLAALPNTSFNNITGTWSPALNNTATTTYTFTPTAGQCATTATMTITVNPIITPAFTQVAAICSGADLSPLPTSSTNGINGTWTPALNYTATTTYTFTPIARQCATTATMTITVNPNIAPTFTQVTPICAGATLAALPTTSNNGYTGTWSPAMNNTATTTYTFTPTGGLCATTATMTITVNPLPLPPTGTITQTFCANIYPTLQNIVVTPANVNWFSSLTSSTPLPITTNLPVGSTTYYASQFDAVTGCSSNGRLAVLATVLLENTPSTLTDQTFCSTDLKTLADIKTNGLNIVWYSSASGGTPLLGSYVLTSSQSLYAAIYNATTGCESPIRQMVQITIINCQLVANNLLTLNDNSLNDNLKIENIENFPINQIEIYNRFGEIVWKTEYYNNDSNTFKGRANVSGVYQKDSDLPTGTYYFLLKYYDSYRGKYTDLKSFLYINNNN